VSPLIEGGLDQGGKATRGTVARPPASPLRGSVHPQTLDPGSRRGTPPLFVAERLLTARRPSPGLAHRRWTLPVKPPGQAS
jgi:hypothetical protein